jgi:hypothetical protein
MFFGLISTSVAAIALAAPPNFRPGRRQFSDRFLYFLWSYCVLVWGFQEVIFVPGLLSMERLGAEAKNGRGPSRASALGAQGGK